MSSSITALPTATGTLPTTSSSSVVLPGPTISSTDFDEVRKEVVSMKEKFDVWAEAQKQSLHEKKQRHVNLLAMEKQTIESLERRHEELISKGQELRQSILKAQEDAIHMEHDLQELDKTKEGMSERRHSIQKHLQDFLTKIQQETQGKE